MFWCDSDGLHPEARLMTSELDCTNALSQTHLKRSEPIHPALILSSLAAQMFILPFAGGFTQ